MDGHCRDIADAVHVPDPAEEFILAEDVIGVLRQESEQVKLLGGEVFLRTVHKYTAGRLVDLQAPDLDHIIGLLSRTDQPLVAGHMGFYPGDQLAGAEGFCHIVIRSQSQAADLVDIIFFG